ncbi:MAG: hypothetical protein IKP60_09090 [Treponema sp.]|nr:hypothetical protein [Treponema sp.]
MKKICFVIALLFSFCKIFAQDSGPVSFYTDDYYLGKYTIESNKIIFTNEDASEGEREKTYPRSSLKLNNNGYYYFEFSKNDKQLLIFGNDFFGYFFDPGKISKNLVDEYVGYCEANDYYYRIKRRDYPITTFKASSELKEEKNVYSVDNLKKFFLGLDCVDSAMPFFNPKHKPWVEGVSGNGIGEYIEISADKEFNNLQILNGYVDVSRLDLYKKNSRVKSFVVEDFDNKTKFEIELKDEVVFQYFNLEKPTTHIRLTIKEVYKGSKWEDTCVSSIIPY